MEELTQKLVLWIRDQVKTAKSKGIVLGLSGGVDSAVVAALCKRAFPHNTLALYMPCYSQRTDEEHARAVAAQLEIPLKMVPLEAAYDSLLQAFPDTELDPTTQKMAQANLRPRLRMIALYYMANRLNYLVVGTSNKSEITVGYFTKYGDGGSDIVPLGNLLKRDVIKLAAHLEIPREVIERTPSAGLWPGQTDEAEMGLTYEALDRYLASGEAAAQIKDKVEAMIAATTHKRAMPPVPPF